jgi:hypothetical protein
MWDHMRFVDGSVEGRSKHGERAIDLLRLNSPSFVDLRGLYLRSIKMADGNIRSIDAKLRRLRKLKNSGKISEERFAEKVALLSAVRESAAKDLATLTGQVPVTEPPYR